MHSNVHNGTRGNARGKQDRRELYQMGALSDEDLRASDKHSARVQRAQKITHRHPSICGRPEFREFTSLEALEANSPSFPTVKVNESAVSDMTTTGRERG